MCYFAQDLLYSCRMLLSGLECAMFTGPVLPKVNFLKIEQMPTKCGPLLGSNADQMGTKMPTNADLVSVHTHIEQK